MCEVTHKIASGSVFSWVSRLSDLDQPAHSMSLEPPLCNFRSGFLLMTSLYWGLNSVPEFQPRQGQLLGFV